MERRRASRARCRIPCDVAVRGKTVEGTVRNISEGGLALEAPPEVASEGDSLALTLKPPGRPPIDLVALLWHARTLRGNGGGAGPVRLGLVLSEAGDDYFRLVDLLTGRLPAAPAASPGAESQPGSEPGAGPPPDPTPLLHFAVRVAQSGSPRTRRILVRAVDADAARRRTLEATGPGWSAVAVALARDGEGRPR